MGHRIFKCRNVYLFLILTYLKHRLVNVILKTTILKNALTTMIRKRTDEGH